MRKLYRILAMFFLVAMTGMIAGCVNAEIRPVELQEGEYILYYKTPGAENVVSHIYSAQKTDVTELIGELYDMLRNPPMDGYVSVVPSDLYILSGERSGLSASTLVLSFSENYSKMDGLSEIRFRSSIVRTMVQIDGIDNVVFRIGDQPLRSASGSLYGPMNASSFISDVEDAMDDLGFVELTLYYSDPEGDALIGEKTKLAYSSVISIEQVIVEQLTKGPVTSRCKAAVPSSVNVISVSTKDGICYVNFDNSFLNSIADCNAQVTLFSIVNSLTELSNVKKVQIQVNGSTDAVFREVYPLSEVYERDLNLIESSIEVEPKINETERN